MRTSSLAAAIVAGALLAGCSKPEPDAGGAPFGGLLSDTWDTRTKALAEKRRLELDEPVRKSIGGRRERVRYVVFAGHDNDIRGLQFREWLHKEQQNCQCA
jgi:hypothetical protein